MKTIRKLLSLLLACTLLYSFAGTALAENADERTAIEEALNLRNNADQTWTYNAAADAWVLSAVAAVTHPVLADYQGVSVCVPGSYVTGIDTDGDGTADVSAQDAENGVKGSLVIDHEASVTSSHGQTYRADTAPVLFETGGAGYSAQANSTAGTAYAAEGYIYMVSGNRGKQSSYSDADGNTVYTGDAPDLVVDGKNAIRYVRYNILLGNLPGDPEKFITTGGSGAGAHTIMIASTGNSAAYFPYEAECGAAGIYLNADGTWDNTVSDAVWGAVGYSPITSLAEADLAMAFEYSLDPTYAFGSTFQKTLAGYLSEAYMDYINSCGYTVKEADVGFDLDGDGALDSELPVTITWDEENGYGGTYLDLYLAEFISNLQAYIDNLDYAEGWTWFDSQGEALSDEAVAAMTLEEKAQAFIEGRYTKASTGRGGFGGNGPAGGFGGRGGFGDGNGPDGNFGGFGDGNGPRGNGGFGGFGGNGPDGNFGGEGNVPDLGNLGGEDFPFPGNGDGVTDSIGNSVEVGTPDAGSTQSASGTTDTRNYTSFQELLEAYRADIAQVEAGDEYGNNQVTLYDPIAFIGAEDVDSPVWVRMVSGAVEGDISMMNSLNLQLKMLSAGIDAVIEWQWDGGHVPSEILGDSLSLYIDQMVGKYVEGFAEVSKEAAQSVTANGTSEAASGKDLSGWMTLSEDGKVSFTIADVAAYRTSGASKAIPGFDVFDYGQEDYVFGTSTQDARHWNRLLLNVLEAHADDLSGLLNQN